MDCCFAAAAAAAAAVLIVVVVVVGIVAKARSVHSFLRGIRSSTQLDAIFDEYAKYRKKSDPFGKSASASAVLSRRGYKMYEMTLNFINGLWGIKQLGEDKSRIKAKGGRGEKYNSNINMREKSWNIDNFLLEKSNGYESGVWVSRLVEGPKIT